MFTLRKETLIERFITLSFRDKESFKILYCSYIVHECGTQFHEHFKTALGSTLADYCRLRSIRVGLGRPRSPWVNLGRLGSAGANQDRFIPEPNPSLKTLITPSGCRLTSSKKRDMACSCSL